MRSICMLTWGVGLTLMLVSAWVASHASTSDHAGTVAESVRWLGEQMHGASEWEETKSRDLALVVTMVSAGLMVISACVQIVMVDIANRKWA